MRPFQIPGRLRRQARGGFTLIEFMMAMALSGVVFGVLYAVLGAAVDSYNLGQLRSNAVQNGRLALVRIVNELKYADKVYTGYSSTYIGFQKQSEAATPATQVVEFNYDSATGEISRRQDLGTWYVFAENVSALTFTYRNRSLGAATSTQDIRFVEMDLRMTNGDYTVPLRNLVRLSNPLDAK